MNEVQIKEVIIKALKRIAPEADPEELPPGKNVREALDIDSYDFLMFLMGLNEELGVDVPEADYGKLISMDDIVGYLSARVADKV
jgi:acyl carrier protein